MAVALIPRWRDDTTMTFGELCRDCLRYLTMQQGYSANTEADYSRAYDQYRAYLRDVAKLPDVLRSFTKQTVMGFAAYLAEPRRYTTKQGMARVVQIGANTIILRLSALSTLATYAMTREDERGRPLLEHNPTKRFAWPTYEHPDTPFLHPDELRTFLEIPMPPYAAVARDMLLDTGVRVSEACRADVGDLVEIGGAWTLGETVKGRGTRKRKIRVPLSAPTAAGLRAFLLDRKMPPPEAPLLVDRHGQRYKRRALSNLMARFARQAGIARFNVTAHKLRHTVNVVRKVGGVPALERSRLLGQTSVKSQERYDHVAPGGLLEAKDQQAEGLAKYLGTTK